LASRHAALRASSQRHYDLGTFCCRRISARVYVERGGALRLHRELRRGDFSPYDRCQVPESIRAFRRRPYLGPPPPPGFSPHRIAGPKPSRFRRLRARRIRFKSPSYAGAFHKIGGNLPVQGV
jgi:hypothetical protein